MRGRPVKHAIALCLCLAGLTACSMFNSAPNNYLVFFDTGASTLSPAGRAIVDQAASAIKRSSPRLVVVSTGVLAGDNLKLAEPRFTAIQTALVADGVASDIIARASLSDPRINVGALGDQRAEILVVQKQ